MHQFRTVSGKTKRQKKSSPTSTNAILSIVFYATREYIVICYMYTVERLCVLSACAENIRQKEKQKQTNSCTHTRVRVIRTITDLL